MSTEALLRHAVKGALALGSAGSLVGAGAALAQTAAPAAGTAGGTQKLSNIVVTGSHIPQTSIATAQPVITINRQEIDNTGFTTTGELLQNLTQSGTALNVQFNNGGNGQQQINLHDLGSQRVLVLVNGQRWIPTLGGAVDLTTIPLAVVDRVEILLDGASAIYGSEAMAGVINIITKKNYNGAEAHAYMGMYDGHGDGGGWDGRTQSYSFTVGTSGDKSSVLLSASYYQQNPIWAGQRTISKEPFVGSGNTFGSFGSPGGNFAIFTPYYYGHTTPTFPGCGTQGYFGYPGCVTAGPFDGSEHAYTGADHYNYAPLNYLQTPSERWNIYSQGHYDLTDNLTFNFLTTYNRRNSTQLLAPNPWFLCAGPVGDGCLHADGLALGVSANNQYNPFGQDLVPAYATSSPTYGPWCAKYGSGANGTCSSNWQTLGTIGLRPISAGTRNFNQNVQTFYFNGGLNGYFNLAGNEWNWGADYIYGQTMNTTITTGLANTARMQNALASQSYCSQLPGCVPLNLFGGGNNLTPGMTNYILFTAHDVSDSVVRDYNAHVGGNFFNSWYAGPWGAAAGYEYNENDGYFSPDPTIASGNTVGNVASPTSGRIASNAQFAELSIPFASNAPLAKELSVDLANRWEQYKWDGIGNLYNSNTQQVTVAQTGERAHSAAGRITLQWKPIDSLLFRGTWSQGFRAPSLSELFAGVGDNFPSLTDPCATATPAPYCAANGRPANSFQPNGQIHTSIGGQATLEPETSVSRSVGFVWSPNFVPGLDISADYYKVEILNYMGSLGGQYYLDQCYNYNSQDACSHIILSGNGAQVLNIVDLVTNNGSDKVEGWDTNVRYKLPTTPAGDFTVNLNMNFMKQDTFCTATGQCTDYAGSALGNTFFGQPKHRYNLGLNWNYGPWSATWNMYVIGALWESCSTPGVGGAGKIGYDMANGNCSNPEKDQNHLGTTIYHDVQASYTVSSWNTTFTLGINNLFDKEPPISLTAFANSYLPVYYRPPGRFFYGRISVNF